MAKHNKLPDVLLLMSDEKHIKIKCGVKRCKSDESL